MAATKAREQLFAGDRFAAIGFGDTGFEFCQFFRPEVDFFLMPSRDDQNVGSIDKRRVVQDYLA